MSREAPSDAQSELPAAEAVEARSHTPGADDAELPAELASILDAAAPSESKPLPAGEASHAAPLPAQLTLATVLEVKDTSALLKLGFDTVEVKLVHVHPAVMRTACERGEPVLVQRQPDGSYWVAGALRTQPTPGVDAVDEIDLEAKRIRLRASEEITVEATKSARGLHDRPTARIALRAAGEIETYASRILSKAEEVHKIVGRMLRLN
jgi:hypothetical protein